MKTPGLRWPVLTSSHGDMCQRGPGIRGRLTVAVLAEMSPETERR